VPGPLDDVVVVDLTRALAGPHAAMMLGDLGARVIKVESPTGDDSRGWGPPFVGPPDDPESTYFMAANRNKESVIADLKTEAGRDFLQRLVVRADVLLENFRPGVLDRLGFSTEQLLAMNPRLVVLSITGFGRDGPDGGRSGYDQIAQGEAGLMSITGPDPSQPTKVGLPAGDLLAGMYGAYGVVAALYERERTGRGRVVRTSLLSAIVGTHAYQGTMWTVGHRVPVAMGNHHPSISPYGLFHAADSAVQIACGSQGLWRSFAPLVDIDPDDPRFATNRLRVDHRDELIAAIDAAFVRRPAREWLERLDRAGIPAGRVRSMDEVYAWDQTRSQGLVIEVDHPTAGRVELPGPPLRFDDLPYAGGRAEHLPPPRLGEHDRAVRDWLEDA
jgi:crotonobetainyl-CoA:carnitine CoA-transferase CaiB-like acyl-CoA transferase